MASHSDHCDDMLSDPCSQQKSFLILDVGGGTVDITVLKHIPPDSYEIISPPLGSEFGGMKVNQRFSKFLQEIVLDPEFSRFVSENKNEHQAAVTTMINYDFEKIKVKFGDKPTTSHLRLLLNRQFVSFYTLPFLKEQIEQHGDPRIKLTGETLEIHKSKMEEFFKEILMEIVGSVLNVLEEHKVDAVYSAGGFGGCNFVVKYVRNAIFKTKKKQLPFLVPAYHMLAVSQGAIHYCRKPDIITARMMDATYGVGISTSFIKGKHKDKYCIVDDEGCKLCENIFLPFVYQNEKVKLSDVFVADLLPMNKRQTKVSFKFYCSTNPNVVYVTDENTKKIGELILEIPNPHGIPKSQRKLQVTMSFSSTEITAHARALYLPSQPALKTVLDFLMK